MKQSRFFWENQKRKIWEKNRGLGELNGKTVLILGCGDAGTECAKRFRAFGCRVIGANRTGKESECFEKVFPLERLDPLLPEADIVVLTLALTEETRHLLNARRLSLLKSTAILVNISRGALIEQKALEEKIEKLGGGCFWMCLRPSR